MRCCFCQGNKCRAGTCTSANCYTSFTMLQMCSSSEPHCQVRTFNSINITFINFSSLIAVVFSELLHTRISVCLVLLKLTPSSCYPCFSTNFVINLWIYFLNLSKFGELQEKGTRGHKMYQYELKIAFYLNRLRNKLFIQKNLKNKHKKYLYDTFYEHK